MQTATMLDLIEVPNRAMMVREDSLETLPPFPGPCTDEPFTQDPLTASIMHDLRNPLTAICASAELLLDQNLAPAQTRRVASNIRRSAGRMRELLAEFCFLVRGHAEAAQCCRLRQLVAASAEAAGIPERDGMELWLDVPARIELLVARARMERVFVNLIVNAMEAMPGGGIIRITAIELGDCVFIEVEDNGPGIPAEIRSRLFEPFVTAGKREGLGLGLALSRQTVRDHGGDLWHEPASGARFVLSLPLGRVSAETHAA